MTTRTPFDAVGVRDYEVVAIQKGAEYTVVEVSPDGLKFKIRLPDGSTGWTPAKFVRVLQQPQKQTPTRNYESTNEDEAKRQYETDKKAAQDSKARKQVLRQKFTEKQGNSSQRVPQQEEEDESWVNDMVHNIQKTNISAKPEPFLTTRGFLANAPGFADLSNFNFDDDDTVAPDDWPDLAAKRNQQQQQTHSTQQVQQTQQTQQEQVKKSGVYYPVEKTNQFSDYKTNNDLPDHYKSSKWKCHSCSVVNQANSEKCIMCGTNRCLQSSLVDDSVPVSTSKNPNGEWNCPSCTVANPPSKSICRMCGATFKEVPKVTINSATPTKKPGPKSPAGAKQKKQIISKASSNIELQYAKKVDVYSYKSGSSAIPGHGAGY